MTGESRFSAAAGSVLRHGTRWITFDCYGTLVDWERGMLACLRPLLKAAGVRATDGEIFARYSAFERAAEGGEYIAYREVLGRVMDGLSAEYPGRWAAGARSKLADSVPGWPAFDETPRALALIGSAYRLAVLSNVDDAMFAATRKKLESGGATLSEVVTSEQVRSYKPRTAHFQEFLRRAGASRCDVLHVAESRYHDVEPCNALGIRCVLVSRRGREGQSARDAATASGPGGGVPTAVVASLTELCHQLDHRT